MEILRAIVYGHKIHYNLITPNTSPIYHHSVWTKKKLESFGFQVTGCLGSVTRRRIKFQLLGDIYDFFAKYFPLLAGTLIGVKYVRRQR